MLPELAGLFSGPQGTQRKVSTVLGIDLPWRQE